MNGTPEGFLIRRLDGSHHQHTSGLGLLQKRREQSPLFFGSEMSMPTPASGLAPEHGFARPGIIRLQLPPRLWLPAQGLRDLGSAQVQSGSQPHALEALVNRLGFDLWQEGSEPFGGSVGECLLSGHGLNSPPGLLTAYSCCLLNAN
jgi:hypothetical protein